MKSAIKRWANSALQPKSIMREDGSCLWRHPPGSKQLPAGIHRPSWAYMGTSGSTLQVCTDFSARAVPTTPQSLKSWVSSFKIKSQRQNISRLQTISQHLHFQQQAQPEYSLIVPEQLGSREKDLYIKLIIWGRRTWQLMADASGL